MRYLLAATGHARDRQTKSEHSFTFSLSLIMTRRATGHGTLPHCTLVALVTSLVTRSVRAERRGVC